MTEAESGQRTIHAAIALSMLINFAAILLSVRGLPTPTTGALVHNAGFCLVVLLAALLYDRKYDACDERKATARTGGAHATWAGMGR